MARYEKKSIQAILCPCDRQETFPFDYELYKGSEGKGESEVVIQCPLCAKEEVRFRVEGKIKLNKTLYRNFLK